MATILKRLFLLIAVKNTIKEGPDRFKPVGETEFVVEIAKQGRQNPDKAQIAGIIGHANMMLGPSVKEVLEMHQEKGEGF